MEKQVNASYDCVSEGMTYWTGEWSADGYKGRLTDTVYVDGASWTDWGLFVGTEEECAQFIAICEKKGEKEALAWAREKAQQTTCTRLSTH